MDKIKEANQYSGIGDGAEQENKGYHDFEARRGKVPKTGLPFLCYKLFQAGIQMDIDAEDHGEEGIAFSGVDVHIMKMIIVENAVVYPFTESLVLVNTAAIEERGAGILARTGAHFAAGKGQRHLRECFCLQ